MTQPDLLFAMRLNKARHDQVFQYYLATSFGKPIIVQVDQSVVIGYLWRTWVYTVETHENTTIQDFLDKLPEINKPE